MSWHLARGCSRCSHELDLNAHKFACAFRRQCTSLASSSSSSSKICVKTPMHWHPPLLSAVLGLHGQRLISSNASPSLNASFSHFSAIFSLPNAPFHLMCASSPTAPTVGGPFRIHGLRRSAKCYSSHILGYLVLPNHPQPY